MNDYKGYSLFNEVKDPRVQADKRFDALLTVYDELGDDGAQGYLDELPMEDVGVLIEKMVLGVLTQ